MTNKILVIEDEPSIVEMIQLNLELEGYHVNVCSNGKVALGLQDHLKEYCLVVLDVMLPEVSGLDICRAFRAKSDVPILFLSAKGTVTDRVAGLRLGANDYLPKPFDLEELLLRVNNLIRSRAAEEEIPNSITIGNKEVNFVSFEVKEVETGEKLDLSKREIELLRLFSSRRDAVVSRDEILNELWSNEHFPTGRTIDNYILNFRKIFEPDPKNPIYFHSVRGVGYRFTMAD